jgi:hypothetical protein
MKMEAVNSSELLVNFYQSPWRHRLISNCEEEFGSATLNYFYNYFAQCLSNVNMRSRILTSVVLKVAVFWERQAMKFERLLPKFRRIQL